MRSRYRIYSESGIYFVTSTILDWIPIIINDSINQIILSSFKYCQEKKNLLIFGFVTMPNHFHMLIGMQQPDKIPGVMRDLKRDTLQAIREYLKGSQKYRDLSWLRPFWGSDINNLWQQGYHPVLIKSDEWFEEKLDYIHMNPVKKGFVEQPQYWKYSSARNYISGDDSLIKLDMLH